MIIECIELNWLCKHMEKGRSCQAEILVLNCVKHSFSLWVTLTWDLLAKVSISHFPWTISTDNHFNQVLLFADYRPQFLMMSYPWLKFNSNRIDHSCIIRKNLSISSHTAYLVEKQSRQSQNQKIKFSMKSVFGKHEQIHNYLWNFWHTPNKRRKDNFYV